MNTSSNSLRKNPTIPPEAKLTQWPIRHALRVARERAKSITDAGGNSKVVQAMLAQLMEESGWEESDFIDELCKDIASRKHG